MHGIRQIIETVSGKLPLVFRLATDRLHTLPGFRARLAAKVGLHNFCGWLNLQLGRPALAFADLLDFSLTPNVHVFLVYVFKMARKNTFSTATFCKGDLSPLKNSSFLFNYRKELAMKRRTLLTLVLLLFFALGGIGPAYAAVPRTQQPQQQNNRSIAKAITDTDRELLNRNPLSSSGFCGVERWSVKTGTDADVSLINLQSVTPTTIAALSSLPAPSILPANTRIQPTETTG